MQPTTPPPAGGPSNTLGLLALILGIASIPLVLCYALGLPVGIAAIVLGVLGLRQARLGRASNRGQALAGLVCGAVGTLAMVVIIALPD